MNIFEQRLAAGRLMAGIWIGLDSVTSIELAGNCGFDWAILDLEHGHFQEADLLHGLRAAQCAGIAPIVRIPDATSGRIGRCLDWGAAGIMVPNVQNAQEAERIARAMRFAPQGDRGVSRSVRSMNYGLGENKNSHRNLLTIVQIESVKGVERMDEIAAVTGIDALFLGHTDLSQELDCLGKLDDPRIVAAEEKLLRACRSHQKIAGMATSAAAAPAALARGFSLLTIASDLTALRDAMRRAVAEAAQR